MYGKTRVLAQLLTVATLLLVGTGLYTFSLESRLEATLESIMAVEQDRNAWKSKAEQAEGSIEAAAISLDQCTARIGAFQGRRAESHRS